MFGYLYVFLEKCLFRYSAHYFIWSFFLYWSVWAIYISWRLMPWWLLHWQIELSLFIVSFAVLLFFLMSVAIGLLVLFIFSTSFLVSVIFSLNFLVSILISALMFNISFLLLTLGFVCFSLSGCFRCKLSLVFEVFPEVSLYHYKLLF